MLISSYNTNYSLFRTRTIRDILTIKKGYPVQNNPFRKVMNATKYFNELLSSFS